MFLALLSSISEPDGLPASGSKHCRSIQTSGSEAKGLSHSEHEDNRWLPGVPLLPTWLPGPQTKPKLYFQISCRDAGKGASRLQCKAAPCCLRAMLGQIPFLPLGYTGQKEAWVGMPAGRENQASSRSTVPV